MIDAAGAIYVIGGQGSNVFKDVWASTDGGADGTPGCLALPWHGGDRRYL